MKVLGRLKYFHKSCKLLLIKFRKTITGMDMSTEYFFSQSRAKKLQRKDENTVGFLQAIDLTSGQIFKWTPNVSQTHDRTLQGKFDPQNIVVIRYYDGQPPSYELEQVTNDFSEGLRQKFSKNCRTPEEYQRVDSVLKERSERLRERFVTVERMISGDTISVKQAERLQMLCERHQIIMPTVTGYTPRRGITWKCRKLLSCRS